MFDPKVVYDPYHGQFVLVFLAGHGRPFGPGANQSWILVVTIPEGSAADQGTWCRRRLRGDQVAKDGAQFADYPGLGFDRKRVYVTTNQFSFEGIKAFEYAQIVALWKSGLYRCGQKVRREVFAGEETRDGTRDRAFTIQPAITEGATGRTPEFLVSFQDKSCGSGCASRYGESRSGQGKASRWPAMLSVWDGPRSRRSAPRRTDRRPARSSNTAGTRETSGWSRRSMTPPETGCTRRTP